MKFEIKTQNEAFSQSFLSFLLTFALLSFIVILSNISIKLGTISKNYEINHICKILTIDRSALNFKKLSKLTNQTSKQKILDLCREIVK
tara:strand:+ start:778 stop:1044 length:267 start_codon:yes stop_codon:yes gene_type:complete